ncbi:MAG: hypothetical protein KJO04_03665 [Bacteroidia bacterium]|nr:hypothetical protein [Bacteroidia bacterium]
MNIEESLIFNTEKPAVLSIKKSEDLNLMAIGLLRDQVLKKHKTNVPATLLVLKGGIDFLISDTEIPLVVHDVFQIPVNKEHEVRGTESENIFILLKEK